MIWVLCLIPMSFFPPPDTRQDSSLVAALNSLGNPIDEIHELFFEAKT